MQTRLTVAASLVFSLLVLSSCQDDLTAEKAQWDTAQKNWTAKVEKIRKDQTALMTKVKAFTVPESEPELAAAKAELDKSVAAIDGAVADAEKAVGAVKATVDGLIAKGKKVQVEVALSGELKKADGPLGRAESLVSAGGEQLEQLEKKVQTAKAEGDAAKSRTEAWSGEVKKKGGMMSIDDITFANDAVVPEKSRVALTSLVATLKTCPEVRVEVLVTANSEDAELSTRRAEALKTFVTGKGVDAAVFAKVAGKSEKDADEKVAVTVTTPCK